MESRHHIYPSPDDITINEADFKLQLQDFGKANKNKISWKDILILISAWAILVTANFNSIEVPWKIDGLTLRGLYAALLVIGTLGYFIKIWWHVQRLVLWATKKIGMWIFKIDESGHVKLSDYCKKYGHISNAVDKVESIKTIIDKVKNSNGRR